jgi:hypothetical protein
MWKETGELPVCDKCLKPIQEYTNLRERQVELERRRKEGLRSCLHQDGRFRGSWPHWCLDAVSVGPERYWYRLTVEERMVASPFAGWHIGRYQTFLREKDSETVPLLLRFYEDYYRSSTVPGSYQSTQHVETYRRLFSPILTLANSRHADLLEKFIAGNPTLAPLTNKLAEVRARPAPPPVTEPPFRLGTNTVVIVP